MAATGGDELDIGPSGGDAEVPGVPSITEEQVIESVLCDEAQKRMWLKSIVAILQTRSHESDPSGRVQFAYDQLHIAACERASRILRSDLPPTESI